MSTILKHALIIGLSLFCCGGAFVNTTQQSKPEVAVPLHYRFDNNPSPVYEVVIRSEGPQAVETDAGYISYVVKSVDPGNGQVLLQYSPIFRKSVRAEDASDSQQPASTEPTSAELPPMLLKSSAELASAPPMMIDPLGKIVRDDQLVSEQLPFSMGPSKTLLLQPLPPANEKDWQTERPLTLYYYKQSQGNHGPMQQQATPQLFNRSAHESIAYSVSSIDGPLVSIHRKIEVVTDEKVGDTPIQKVNGEGDYVFDANNGLIQSLTFKQVTEVTQSNYSFKISTTVNAHLMSADEIARARAKETDRQAAFKAVSEKYAARATQRRAQRQTDAESEALAMLPTTQQSDIELKTIEGQWQPSKSQFADLLDQMQGDCIRQKDGSVLLARGQRITTAESYRVPRSFRIVILTDRKDVRLSYAADQVIFNWEMDPTQLRIDGGPANGKHKADAGSIPQGRWVAIEWVVRPDEMILYVDGTERYRAKEDFSEIHKPFGIEAHNGPVWVRNISVERVDVAH